MTNHSEKDIIIKKYGYVCKGGGSAYGGKWKPKDEIHMTMKFHGKTTIRTPDPPINYWDSLPPELKSFTGGIIMDNENNTNKTFNIYGEKFETLGEFKFYLSTGWNLGMQYKGVEYGIEGHNNSFDIWIYDEDVIAKGITLEETLDFEFDGVKLRDFITTDDVEILERHL